MFFDSFSRSFPSRRSTSRLRRLRPKMEGLEGRLVLANFTVTSLADNGSAGTLRSAIQQANANPGDDTIDFGVTGTIFMNGTQMPAISGNLTIQGPAGGIAISASNSRIFDVPFDAGLSLNSLTLTNGFLFNAGNGGLIQNAGSLSLNQVELTRSAADEGGAVRNSGNMTVSESRFANNTSRNGGAIYNLGVLSIVNSAFSSNHASYAGGAIFNVRSGFSGGSLTITRSSFNGSSADDGGTIENRSSLDFVESVVDGSNANRGVGGVINNTGSARIVGSTFLNGFASAGGVIRSAGSLTLTNSTLSFNATPNSSQSGGLFIDGSTATVTNTTISDNVGGIRNAGRLILTNSIVANNGFQMDYSGNAFEGGNNLFGNLALGPLENNGGPTPTRALPANSPAINAGTPALEKDQRGTWRDSTPDIGAFETANLLYVTTLVDENNNGDISESFGTGVSLREAMAFGPNLQSKTIRFASSLSSPGTITLQLGALPTVTNDLTIQGPGASRLSIDARGASRILQFASTARGVVAGIALANGSDTQGGAVLNQGNLTLTDNILTGNTATTSGGAVMNVGTLSISGSELSNNTAPTGGAILNQGTLTVATSTLARNRSTNNGSALLNDGTASLANSTFAENRGTGAIFTGAAAQTTINNSIIGNNTLASSSTSSDFAGASVVVASSGNNLIGPGGSGGLSNGTNGNLVASTVTALGVGTFGDYGGMTKTVPLLSTSPALNAANVALVSTVDQRGALRDATPDIGAFEVLQRFVVTTLTDENNGTVLSTAGTGTSLREAIDFANRNPGEDTITVDLAGTIQLNGTQLPSLTQNVTLTGSRAGVRVDAGGQSRVLQVAPGVQASVTRMTLANGRADLGAGVLNAGTLSLSESTVSGNTATSEGAGIFNSGNLSLTNSTVTNNSAGVAGGGIKNTGSLTVLHGTISGNTADLGGGITSAASGPGQPGVTTLNNSIVGGNFQSDGITPNDLAGSTPVSSTSRSNLIGPGGSGGLIDGSNGNTITNSVSALGLSELLFYGGPTQTIALLPTSPAVNRASVSLGTFQDQRSAPRDSQPDIGAYELLPRIVITTLTDENDGTIDPRQGTGTSLREAIAFSNSSVSAEHLDFATNGTILLNGTQLPTIVSDLTVTGPVNGLIIDGQQLSRIFEVASGVNVALSQLTLRNGRTSTWGGAIYNDGLLSLERMTLLNNSASQKGGAIQNFRNGMLSIVDSTLSGNSSPVSAGAVMNYGTLSLANSTLTGNSAGAAAGVLYNTSSATMDIVNTTFAGNSAGNLAAAIFNGGNLSVKNVTMQSNRSSSGAGAILSSSFATMTVWNSIFATSMVFGNYSGGNNLFDDFGFNPLGLGALGPYGGPTATIPLLAGSPAINAGNTSVAPFTDQRGLIRDSQADIGAYEIVSNFVVTTLADEDDGTVLPDLGTGTSLREAIAFGNLNPGPDRITFAVDGTISLGGTQFPTISSDLTIVGPAAGITIDAQDASRIFQMNASAQVTLERLTLSNGHAADSGGAIHNAGTLSLTDITVRDSNADVDGGGIWNSGPLSMNRVIMTQNVATRDGGGLFSSVSPTTITNSQFSNNAARSGGAIASTSSLSLTDTSLSNNQALIDGGGIRNSGPVVLTRATLSGNLAGGSGGGIHSASTLTINDSTLSDNSAQNGAAISSQGTLTLTDTLVRDNRASANGGGVYGTGSMSLTRATITGNTATNGAGAWSGSSLLVASSTFSDNVAVTDGGGLFGSAGTVSVNQSIFSGNRAQQGGAIAANNGLTLIGTTLTNNSASSDGGALYTTGATTITGSTLNNNHASLRGGAISSPAGTVSILNSILDNNEAESGGGIFNRGTLQLTASTVLSNVSATNGGGITNGGTMSVTNSTVTLNATTGAGGGILNAGSLTVANSTISRNSANDSGGIASQILFANTPSITTLTNTLVGANTLSDGQTPSDLSGDVAVPASRHNLIGPGGSGGLSNGVNGNLIAPVVADLGLGTLGNYGGSTPIIPLLDNSLALDAGNNTLIPVGITTDQRGSAPRIFGERVDIGSFEAAINLVVTTLIDEDSQVAGSPNTGTSLREAIFIANQNPGKEVITFAVSGTLNLNGTALPAITSALRISGPATGLTIDGQQSSRIFEVSSGASIELRDLTLAGGHATTSGGAILNWGTLSVSNTTFTENASDSDGGAIANNGSLSIINSTLTANTAQLGGGLFNTGTVIATHVTIADNSAQDGGGVFSHFVSSAQPGLTTLRNTLVGRNTLVNSSTPNDIAGNVPLDSSSNHNLVGPGGSGGLVAGTLGNLITPTADALGLGSLGAYGGATRTLQLLSSSPAIDAGDTASGQALDQRGVPRGAAPDIGAVEFAQSIVVTTLIDEDNGSVAPSIGSGTSLREAIAFTNANGGNPSITFAVNGTMQLNGSPLPTISTDLQILGPAAGVTIDGHQASRLLQISPNISVTLTGLTLTNGRAFDGGAIVNAGNLSIRQSSLTGNQADRDGGSIHNVGTLTLDQVTISGGSSGQFGGAVFSDRSLTVTNSSFSSNSAQRGAGIFGAGTLSVTNVTFDQNRADQGGAIFNQGALTLHNSRLTTNAANREGGGLFNNTSATAELTASTLSGNTARDGAGLINLAQLNISGSTFNDNHAVFQGGGITNRSEMSISDSTLSNNSGRYASGGAIFSTGDLTVSNSTLTGNLASQCGGAISNGSLNDYGGTMTIRNSTISGNSAIIGGGVYARGSSTIIDSTLSGNEGGAGGAIFSYATLHVLGSTLSDNHVYAFGGGIASFRDLTVTNSTIDHNTADGLGIQGGGGGVYSNGSLVMTNSTLVRNAASGGGGLQANGPATLNNTIVGGNTDLDRATPNDVTGLVSATSGHNLFGPGGSGGLVDGQNGNLIVASVAELGIDVLAYNGGPTRTVALLPDSPARDAGANLLAVDSTGSPLTTDQRGVGFARLVGVVDIGAFEAPLPPNQAPTDILLSASSVAENRPAGTVVGALTTVDPDADDTHSYALVAGAGDTDNASFTIDASGNLITASSFNFEAKNIYSVRVRSTDAGGLIFEKALTVRVTNVNESPTASITGPATGVRGQSRAFTLSAVDPDVADVAAGFTFAIQWGDGSPVQNVGPGQLSGALVPHIYAVSGNYTVSLTAIDANGSVSPPVTTTINISSILLQNGAFAVGGTNGSDEIQINRQSNGLIVTLNGNTSARYTGVTSIEVYGQNGNDSISISSTVTLPAFLDGGAGNDFLSGGGGANILLGGAGNDELYGRNGRDLLIGGLGRDTLRGGNGDDLLIGGTTDFDNRRAALDAIMAEWTRTDADYATRIGRLRDGSNGGLNGDTRLNANTVDDDAASDDLAGNDELDWLFALNTGPNADRLRGVNNREVVTSL